MARVALSWLAALFAIESAWLVTCELARERAPWLLVLFVLGPWMLLVRAWLDRIPPAKSPVVLLGATLFALDVMVDLWVPYQPRYAIAGWQFVRLAAVLVAMRVRVPRALGAVLCAGSFALGALVAGTMDFLARTGERSDVRRADAIVVLGFALDAAGHARPPLVDRVARAAELYRAGDAPVVLVSGGAPTSAVTEASVMRRIAIALGVPESALVLEEASRSTAENLAYCAPVLRARHARTVLLVTEPYHEPRALVLARRNHLTAFPAPAVSRAWLDPRARAYWLFREAPLYLVERTRELVGM